MVCACTSFRASMEKEFQENVLRADFSKCDPSSQLNAQLTSDVFHGMLKGEITNVLIRCLLSILHMWSRILDILSTPS